jgi:hypothetical protein
MNLEKHTALATAIALCLGLASAPATDADALSSQTMRPLQGVTLDVGGDRGVTYFLRDNGRCKVVMTLAAEPGADASSFTATRFEATIDGGETTRFVSDDGAAVDFDCELSAQTVSVRPVDEPASAVAVR